jgi:xylan 1,4-beta-xylosidase
MSRVGQGLTGAGALLCALFACITVKPAAQNVAAPFPVAIRVDASRSLGRLPPAWRFFGADEPNYAYLPDGSALIDELGTLAPGHVYFRAHNLLTTGDGTPALKWGSTNAYREDAQGARSTTGRSSIGSSTRTCSAASAVRRDRVHAEALSSHPEPYQHHWTPTAKYNEIFLGWTHPPTDFVKWGDLVHAWAAHAVDRYGRAEVEKWYWEVWNEANIGYWSGTPEQFHKLHDYAVDGVRRALPSARVGGPDVAGDGGEFSRDFFAHVLHGSNFATGGTGTPTDFVSFHAKGKPTFIDGHVRMGIAAQLTTIDAGFRIVSSFPELKRTPIVIGESDPDGCAACQGQQLGYRNTTMYSSYTAAELRADARSGGSPWREPGRRVDVGVRVRGPAAVCRVPRAGDRRDRPARAQRLPDVEPDGDDPRRSAERRLGLARYDDAGGRSGPAGCVRACKPRRSPPDDPALELPRR